MSQWSVYCLELAGGSRTYVGATTDFARRIRQHNGELVGGAKYTTAAAASGGVWKPAFVVRGFPDQTAALQFEWALKKESMRAKGTTRKERREAALESLMRKKRVTSRAELLSSWNLRVERF